MKEGVGKQWVEIPSCYLDNVGGPFIFDCGYDRSLLRPSSDVVLLPCRTKFLLGSTVARQEKNFDSDVVTESNQIQD